MATGFAGSEEKSWFDLENCGMCKALVQEPDLMPHMTWENHLIATGVMSVTTVEAEYAEAYQRACAGMDAAAQKLQAGEPMQLCNFCQSAGALMMQGAQMEQFETEGGTVMLMTATDPEVIKKIHKHGQRTIDEYSKMLAAEKEHHHKEGEHH
jgi:hypothetical protein